MAFFQAGEASLLENMVAVERMEVMKWWNVQESVWIRMHSCLLFTCSLPAWQGE